MAERPKAAVLKTVGHASAPWVRILLPPPYLINHYKIWGFPTSRVFGSGSGPVENGPQDNRVIRDGVPARWEDFCLNCDGGEWQDITLEERRLTGGHGDGGREETEKKGGDHDSAKTGIQM